MVDITTVIKKAFCRFISLLRPVYAAIESLVEAWQATTF